MKMVTKTKRTFDGVVLKDETVNAEYQQLYLEDVDGEAIGTLDFFKGLEGKTVRIMIEEIGENSRERLDEARGKLLGQQRRHQ